MSNIILISTIYSFHGSESSQTHTYDQSSNYYLYFFMKYTDLKYLCPSLHEKHNFNDE